MRTGGTLVYATPVLLSIGQVKIEFVCCCFVKDSFEIGKVTRDGRKLFQEGI